MRTVCCSACGSCRQKVYLQEGRFTVVTCLECGHLYTSPLAETAVFAASYEASGDWIKQADVAAYSGADGRFQRYTATLERLVPPKARILEIGCSKGRFLYQLQQHGFDCYGVEPSRDAEFAARLIGTDRIWHCSYTRLLPVTVEVVLMFEVLEHIPEPHLTAATIFAQLLPGGYLMGSVPNGKFIRMKVWPRRAVGVRSLVVPLTMDAGNHLNYFSPRGLQNMLERAGFEFLWIKNAPLDFNYTAHRLSPLLKRVWSVLARTSHMVSGNLLGSNIWFLARRPG
jgi:2-polyprenyl-3-methyl-5-hydroxy-6-metoxy-1,4-benzoquinol methylase